MHLPWYISQISKCKIRYLKSFYQDETEKEFNWQHKIDWERTETD